MKLNRLATVLTLGFALTSLVSTGCKKKPDYVTPIPGRTTPTGGNSRVPDPGRGQPIVPQGNPTGTEVTDIKPDEGIPPSPRGGHEGWAEDPAALAPETIHFAFDSAAVRSGDRPKLENVASYLKSHPTTAVRVEGNCDKRGTEEYNRALGERRALAAREDLVKLGIAPDRIDTISYGEDRPVDPADNDAAYAQNRRDDFILLSPPAK
jgi:peptidoglycan-associated lipoprotein